MYYILCKLHGNPEHKGFHYKISTAYVAKTATKNPNIFDNQQVSKSNHIR